MNQDKIEYLLTLSPEFPDDSYRDSIVALLTPPAWYRPFARRRFYASLGDRISLIMAEYAKDLLDAIYGGKTQTAGDDTGPAQTQTNQGPV
jgi:hypothetical protein